MKKSLSNNFTFIKMYNQQLTQFERLVVLTVSIYNGGY